MPTSSDMENVGISRVNEIDEPEEHGVAEAAGKQIGKSATKRAMSKHKEAKAKSNAADKDAKSDAAASDKASKAEAKADDKQEDNTMQDMKKAGKNAKRAAAAANVGAKSVLMLKFLNLMNMAMAMIGGFAASIGTAASGFFGFLGHIGAMISSAVTGLVHGVVGFFQGAVSFVSSALGIGTTASAVTVASTTVAVSLATTIVVGGVLVSSNNTAQRDGRLVDCRVAVHEAMDGAEVNADAMQLKNAQNIYSVLHIYGLSDEQIAGVLGNFSTESGIDPTTIEGIYDEKYNIAGSKHQSAMQDWDAYVRGPLSDAYAGFTGSGGPVKNPKGYTAFDGKMYPGIGMGQYTGGGALSFLSFAEQVGAPWYTVEFQLAYTLAKGAPASGADFWEKYKAQTGSARDMAQYFSQYWEGNTTNGFPERLDSAESWYEKLSGWSANESYANSVIALAEQMGNVATDNNVAGKKSVCVSTINADNSSIANAAVSYAYETQAEGIGNNGTELYRRVHDNIFPGDSYYMSCDRGVATAVVWSGSDDTFPIGATGDQLRYLQTSEKWVSVGMASSLTMDDLLPGDVFCLDGHIFLYTGTEAVKAKYPNSNGDSVSASFEERSPGVGLDTTDIIVNRHGQDWLDRGEYEVFRCVKPDNSSLHTNAGAAS